MTEDQPAASPEGGTPSPFSDLIREWLDEGDRLDQKSAASARATPAAAEGPLRRIGRGLRPAFDRYRLVSLAAIGLIPFALFTLTHHAPPVAVVAVVAAAPTPTPPPAAVQPPAPVPPAVERVAARPASAAVPARPAAPVRQDPGPRPGHRSSDHHRSNDHRRSSDHHRRRAALPRGR